MSLFLTKDELFELTGFKQLELQKRALGELGIAFRSRPADGYPLVSRTVIEGEKPKRRREPDWDSMKAAS